MRISDWSSDVCSSDLYPRDAERIRVGQKVAVRSLSGEARLSAEVEAILPTADLASQTLMAHVHMPASAAQQFRRGLGVEGSFAVAEAQVTLAVRTQAIQRFRDFAVVFAKDIGRASWRERVCQNV